MARIRTIKPEFFKSEDIGSLTVSSRLLYVALWCQVDKEGRGKNNRLALAADCMLYEMDQFDACWKELIEAKHVIEYEVENKKYYYLPTFSEHQRPHHTEQESKIPPPNGETTVKQPLCNGATTGRKGKEGKGKEGYSPEFESFWFNYPRKVGKPKAFKSFTRLTEEEKGKATEDCKTRYEDTETKFTPHPSTYLNEKRFNDEGGAPQSTYGAGGI